MDTKPQTLNDTRLFSNVLILNRWLYGYIKIKIYEIEESRKNIDIKIWMLISV